MSSLSIDVLKCPNCGAPLPSEALRRVWTCEYCKQTLTPGESAAWPPPDTESEADEDPALLRRPRVMVAGRPYRVLGRLARGDGSDVFLACRAGRLTEMVVLKVIRALADADLLAREWQILEALHESEAQGAHYFTQLLPQLVAHGAYWSDDGLQRAASVFRWRSGFVHTLRDVAEFYPAGVDARAVVWIYKRTLELLGWIHMSAHVHGAVLPCHILIHPRDHGVLLVGFSSAMRMPAKTGLPALSAAHRAFYPEDLWDGAPPTPESDIVMSARSMISVLGGDPARGWLPAIVPSPIADLLCAFADPSSRAARGVEAWQLAKRVDEAARQAFGPPKYHRLRMPGWR